MNRRRLNNIAETAEESDTDEDIIPESNFRTKESLKRAEIRRTKMNSGYGNDAYAEEKHSNAKRQREIKNFSWDLPATFLLLGKPRSGKSYMTKYLLYLFSIGNALPKDQRFQWITVFTGSKWNNEFADQIPSNYIFQISPDTFDDQLRKYVTHLEKEVEKNGSVPPNALVLDDIVGLLDSNNSFFTHFISTYRKLNMTIFICCQYLMKNVSPTVRECLRYTMAFGSATQRTVEALYETCGQDFDSKQEFKKKFKEITSEPYSAMLFNAYENDPNMNYLRIKAPENMPKIMLQFNPQPVKPKKRGPTYDTPQESPNWQQLM